MKIELLRRHHLDGFLDGNPRSSMRGIAVVNDKETLGICALTTIDGVNFVLCDVREDISKRFVVKGWREFKKLFLSSSEKYFALADRNLETSDGLLRHFGFRPFKDDIYILQGDKWPG